MKKIFILLLMLVSMVNLSSATDLTVLNYANGPVKQISVNKDVRGSRNLLDPDNDEVIQIKYWYDSLGRLMEEAHYLNNRIQYGYVRQYSINNTCMVYEYDEAGITKGSFVQLQFDSLGHQLTSKQYVEGKFFIADSTVYDKYGRKVEYYETKSRQKFFLLRHTYEYDSIGRLTAIKECMHEPKMVICSIEYKQNGDFTEYLFDAGGKKTKSEYIVNEQGILKEVKGRRHIVYSDFDKFGNWRKSKSTSTSEGSIITERIIEYYNK